MACSTIALCVTIWLGQHGYSPQQRDAVLGYIRHESGFRFEKIVPTGACGFQWAGIRRKQVLALGHGRCPSWEVQMEFADRELRTTFRGFWSAHDPARRMHECFGMGRLDP